ncbi:LysR substrate-binding domain-containing protein [Myxococcota bacterium]|nr:LysR substrate-binding domain-containing protein [Myxococcota bacterium]
MMPSSIELRHLRYFLAVAETSSFTRAAARMNIAQPSISQQIKDLEHELGTPLFDRLGKSVRLTEAGQTFRAHAERVLLEVDQAHRSIEQLKGLVTGHLEVGVIPALNAPWIPPVLGKFAELHPGVTLSVREGTTDEVEHGVEAGRFDVGVGILTLSSPNLAYERLLTDDFVLIVPEKHPLAKEDVVAVKDLGDTQLVQLPETYNLRQVVDTIFRAARVRPRIAFEMSTVDSTLLAVERTGTATVLPSVALGVRRQLGLRGVPLSGKYLHIDFGLMWPERAERAPAAKTFGALIAEVARGQAPAKKKRS